MERAADEFEFVRSTGLLDDLADGGLLLPAAPVPRQAYPTINAGARYVLEQPLLPFISYPYEWPFRALKAAALLHLDVYLRALERRVTLSDASAYNVQFLGTRPIFIDTLSFRRYRDGELWVGHRQFLEQFLNPLLLRALLGVPHNAWFRGSPDGIDTAAFHQLLRPRHKLSWKVLTHVTLPARLQTAAASRRGMVPSPSQLPGLPLARFRRMLSGLRDWIERLEPPDAHESTWARYRLQHTYTPQEVEAKRNFVKAFVEKTKPRIVWDLGCNIGGYAAVALGAGAALAIGFDADQHALDAAFAHAHAERRAFLPLWLDAANPSPSQGWAQHERRGLTERRNADALLALALVHHLAIRRNVPLDSLVEWLVDLAPAGVIEFVPKTDPMVQTLLRLREDIFDDYSEDSFRRALHRRAEIIAAETISKAGRTLFWYRRRSA
jgi:ribosomal protein L11 methylase PrmA